MRRYAPFRGRHSVSYMPLATEKKQLLFFPYQTTCRSVGGGQAPSKDKWSRSHNDTPRARAEENRFALPQTPEKELLHGVSAIAYQNMWFMHENASAHFSVAVRNHLHATCPKRWIGRGRPVAWPPRSPDHTPFYFFLLRPPEIACV
ncbi:hypothetical protein TNCV_224301 [Trichonephila clavipes]|nr:hypothetical protein TNCV_224301 [Trichonephila clavipes]